MKTFSVMGTHPGDGSIQKATSPIQALAKHVFLDYGHPNDQDITIEMIEKQIEATPERISYYPKYTVIGDYTVSEVLHE